jgi:SAM-dependent methyltransferase
MEFDTFGRRLGFDLLCRGKRDEGITSLLHPVPIVRYFEFDFVRRACPWDNRKDVLDVSSPRLFTLWLAHKYPNLVVHHTNPDKNDTKMTEAHLGTRFDRGNIKLSNEDATALTFPDDSFDAIISISVIEHIPDHGDTAALKEMWRVLRPGGYLVLTIPCLPKYWDEYFPFDQWGLSTPTKEGLYFASRYYDETAIDSRISKATGCEPERVEIFGEQRSNTFFRYRETEWKKGLSESVKDPYYIATQYRRYSSLDAVPGLAVVGLSFRKP